MIKKITCFLLLLRVIFYLPLLSFGEEKKNPVILDVEVIPASGIRSSTYLILVRIDKPSFVNKIITLNQVREKTEAILLEINDKGVKGDMVKDDNIYTGQSIVPLTAASGTHRFNIFIVDEKGRKSNTLEYVFTVLELV